MIQRGVNPGSIQARLGAALALIENATAAGDLPTVANLVDLVATYVGVHLKPEEMREYRAMPGLAYGDTRSMGQVNADLQARLLFLLVKAKTHHLFAKTEVETGDASSLDSEEELVVA